MLVLLFVYVPVYYIGLLCIILGSYVLFMLYVY